MGKILKPLDDKQGGYAIGGNAIGGNTVPAHFPGYGNKNSAIMGAVGSRVSDTVDLHMYKNAADQIYEDYSETEFTVSDVFAKQFIPLARILENAPEKLNLTDDEKDILRVDLENIMRSPDSVFTNGRVDVNDDSLTLVKKAYGGLGVDAELMLRKTGSLFSTPYRDEMCEEINEELGKSFDPYLQNYGKQMLTVEDIIVTGNSDKTFIQQALSNHKYNPVIHENSQDVIRTGKLQLYQKATEIYNSYNNSDYYITDGCNMGFDMLNQIATEAPEKLHLSEYEISRLQSDIDYIKKNSRLIEQQGGLDLNHPCFDVVKKAYENLSVDWNELLSTTGRGYYMADTSMLPTADMYSKAGECFEHSNDPYVVNYGHMMNAISDTITKQSDAGIYPNEDGFDFSAFQNVVNCLKDTGYNPTIGVDYKMHVRGMNAMKNSYGTNRGISETYVDSSDSKNYGQQAEDRFRGVIRGRTDRSQSFSEPDFD